MNGKLAEIQARLQAVYQNGDVLLLATCLDALLQVLREHFKDEMIHGDMKGL